MLCNVVNLQALNEFGKSTEKKRVLPLIDILKIEQKGVSRSQSQDSIDELEER